MSASEILSFVVGIVGILSIIYTFINNIRKKAKDEGTLEGKIDCLIKSDIEQKDDIKILIKTQDSIKDEVRKIAQIEKSVEKAHSRIDKLSLEVDFIKTKNKGDIAKNGTIN